MPLSTFDPCDTLRESFPEAKENIEGFELPLCDLEATNRDTQTQQLVSNYAVWFVNR
jgi:hypothetical protein